MDKSHKTQNKSLKSKQNQILDLTLSWRGKYCSLTDRNNPSQQLYKIDIDFLFPQTLSFYTFPDGRAFGSGVIRPISIHPLYTVQSRNMKHARSGKIKAVKRFKTWYTYLSYARAVERQQQQQNQQQDSEFDFSSSAPSQAADSDRMRPERMTWEATYTLTQCSLSCIDENHEPIAHFQGYLWGVKKLGYCEFLSDMSDDMREEIIVTGGTLYLCIAYRFSSPLALLGALFTKPGPISYENGEY